MLEDKTTETRQDEPAGAPRHTGFRAKLRSPLGAAPVRPPAAPSPAVSPPQTPAGQCLPEAALVEAGIARWRSALRTGLWRGVCCRAGGTCRQVRRSLGCWRHPPLCKGSGGDGVPRRSTGGQRPVWPHRAVCKGHRVPSHPCPPHPQGAGLRCSI